MKTTKHDPDEVLDDTLERLYALLLATDSDGDDARILTVADIARISTAITTACAERRQRKRVRQRDLAEYSDEEIALHLKNLPERRRSTILGALSGEDLAKKKLFG